MRKILGLGLVCALFVAIGPAAAADTNPSTVEEGQPSKASDGSTGERREEIVQVSPDLPAVMSCSARHPCIPPLTCVFSVCLP